MIKEGVLTDEQLEKRYDRERSCEERFLIRRDTIWVLAKDTLFGASYNADDLANVPGTSVKFSMDTATLTSGSGYTVKKYLKQALSMTIIWGDLDKQLVVNLKDKAEKLEKYPVYVLVH